ncbi:MAG: hypothetical protein R3291_01760, partial [Thermoplasmata archaeon]|nr:hypothetical protein [Thermoplasmata archaeon]
MAKAKRISKDLQEAVEAIYEAKDASRTVKMISILLGAAFLTIAVMNLLDVVELSFLPPGDTDGDGVPDPEHPINRF